MDFILLQLYSLRATEVEFLATRYFGAAGENQIIMCLFCKTARSPLNPKTNTYHEKLECSFSKNGESNGVWYPKKNKKPSVNEVIGKRNLRMLPNVYIRQ